jgi:hypothetical protein
MSSSVGSAALPIASLSAPQPTAAAGPAAARGPLPLAMDRPLGRAPRAPCDCRVVIEFITRYYYLGVLKTTEGLLVMGTTEYRGGHKTGACRALALSIAGQQNRGRHGNPLPVPGILLLSSSTKSGRYRLEWPPRRVASPRGTRGVPSPVPTGPHTHAA